MSAYIGQQPVALATQTRDAFTATAAQTSFATSGYTPGYLDVYLNGVKLAAADYTATNNSDVVLTVGAALNDILEVVAYSTFEAFNETFTGTTTVDILAVTGTVDGRDVAVDGAKLDLINQGVATTDSPTFAGVTLDTTNPVVKSADADGFLTLSGGTGTAIGTQIRLYGESHATAADNITFRSGNSARLVYNASEPVWNFQSEDIKTTGTIETTSGIYLGGTAAANLMDYYEEGTFTPTLTDGANTATTHDFQIGTYTRVGNAVTIEGRCGVSNLGSVSGAVTIAGLPFTARSLANSRAMIVCGGGNGLAITANQTVVGRVNNATAIVTLTLWDSTTGNTNMQHTEFSASGDITFSGVYYV